MTPSEPPPGFDRVLAGRRMCRDYRDEPVDEASLTAVLDAAFRGPSAGNADALVLLVLADAQVARYWDTTLSSQRRSTFPWPGLLRAPVLILPYVSPQAYVDRYARQDKVASGLGEGVECWSVPYWWVDGGAAVMAMLLAAEAQGLGALFFGQFDHEPAVAREFGVPEGWRALGTLALGHRGDDDRPSRSASGGRPGPFGRVHHGGWGRTPCPGKG